MKLANYLVEVNGQLYTYWDPVILACDISTNGYPDKLYKLRQVGFKDIYVQEDVLFFLEEVRSK